MVWILWLLAMAYALLTLTLWWAWRQLSARPLPPTYPPPPETLASPSITVIVPVRNEAANIGYLLTDLAAQTYRSFAVIIADDASTDATAALVSGYVGRVTYPLTLLHLPDNPAVASPKKRAIAHSISQSESDLIVTTDGDCRVGPRWLETIARFYQQTGAKLISGPVTFTTPQPFFGSLQTVEFASLIGAGAATLSLGRPTMCNGANLCYQKAAFEAVNGFAGIDHVASGDDELLMHKIAARYPDGVHFLKQQAAIVETAAHTSGRSFYRQRKRWAGKWRTYSSWFPTLLAVFIFLSNLTPVLAVGGWLAGQLPGTSALLIGALKLLPEFIYLRSVLLFLRRRQAVGWIPLTQLIYPAYVLFFGLVAQRPGTVWKGRQVQV